VALLRLLVYCLLEGKHRSNHLSLNRSSCSTAFCCAPNSDGVWRGNPQLAVKDPTICKVSLNVMDWRRDAGFGGIDSFDEFLSDLKAPRSGVLEVLMQGWRA